MKTKYPIILAHGIAAKQYKIIHAFGRIERVLREEGFLVFVAETDGFGTIKNNAAQLKRYIEGVLRDTGAEKVNIIAHSKGGLDSKYMIKNLGMEDKVASLTTLCTPHKGSIIASWIWRLPLWIKRSIAFFINTFYKLVLKDEEPDSLRACEELQKVHEETDTIDFSEKVYCQSFSTTLERGRDCFIMGIPMRLYRRFGKEENDGMVSEASAKFGNYRGTAVPGLSHVQIIDLFTTKKHKARIYPFYITLCSELSEMGF